MAVALTHKQAVSRLKDIQEEMERLKAKENKAPEDYKRANGLLVEFRQVNQHRLDLEHDAALTEIREAGSVGSASRLERGTPDDDGDRVDETRSGAGQIDGPVRGPDRKRFRNPWDLSEVRTWGRDPDAVKDELRSRAFDAIEQMRAPSYGSRKLKRGRDEVTSNGVKADDVREACNSIIEEYGDADDSKLTRLLLATSSPEYMRAFTKLMKSRGQMAVLNAEEIAAYQRAMSLTDSAGGFLVPFQLDPTVILTAAGSRNQVREISRVVTATGDVWNGITSAGVTGRWAGEATEAGDNAPTFQQPTVPIHKGDVFVPISIEASQDEANVANEIARMIAFEKDRMESVAFVTGSGSGEPTGIVTALTGTASEIAAATADTFALADVYALDGDLASRFAAGASWLAHRKTYNLIRRFDTQGGAALWGFLADPRKTDLLGKPDFEAEAMDGVINAAANNYMLIFGDFENFVIADRIGTTVEYIPHLFGTNRRPTGQRGWYAYFRVGSDSVNDAAFRLLNV